MSDWPVTKASTYTGQPNTDEDKLPCLVWDLNPQFWHASNQGLHLLKLQMLDGVGLVDI
jgi:hypothetical protein